MSAKDPFTKGEAQQTAKNRAGYARYKPPKAPPTHAQNGHGPDTKHYAWNDQGNAERLLDAGGREHLLYLPKRTFPWRYWDTTCWATDDINYVSAWMERTLHAAYTRLWQSGQPRAVQLDEAKHLLRSLDSAKIASALTAVARHVSVKRDIFDTYDWLVPCTNGKTYDFATGVVIDSLPKHHMTRCASVAALTAPASHPQWDTFMWLLFGSDDDLIAYVEWILGLCATGYTGEKIFWFFQGQTDAGKTTLLKFLAWLLGDYIFPIPLRALLKQRQATGILHDIADTEGRRGIYAEEFKPGDELDSGWVKKLTGENAITADRKGEPNISFISTAKLIIGTNDMPALADVDSAIRRRVRVVPFPNNIPSLLRAQGKPVPSSDEVIAGLKEEGAAILYTLMRRVAVWNQGGRVMPLPKVVEDASKHYLDEQDLLVDWLSVCFERDTDGTLTGQVEELPLLRWYWSFLEQSGRSDTRALYQGFGEKLLSKGFTKRKTANGAYFTGPALTCEARQIALEAEYAALEAEARKRAAHVSDNSKQE